MNMITMPLWMGAIIMLISMWSVISLFIIVKLAWRLSRVESNMSAPGIAALINREEE